jgi:hypothetical protein
VTTVWERRDLPVLQALATTEDDNLRHGFLNLDRHSATNALGLDLSAGDIHDAIEALHDVGYVEGNVQYEAGGGRSALYTQLRVTGRGQQALGEWPLFDEIASPTTLALFLERLAEEAPTDEEASSLRRAATYVRKLGVATLRTAVTGSLVALARHQFGLP